MNADPKPPAQDAKPRRAEEQHGWWPGWIWAVPVAAVGIVGWLALRSWTQSGPDVKVIFPVIADLRPGDTKVTFEGYDVGHVEDVHLQPDLTHMRVRLSLDPDMQHHLGKGTEFFIIGKNMSLAHLSDVKSLISGVSVGIHPRPGDKQDQYEGLAEPPVLDFGETGTAMTLHAGKLGSIQRGTPIYYLDQKVGKVEAVRMTGEHSFDFTILVDTPYAGFVHDGTRFWRAGPIHLSTGGNGPSLQFQSISALFEGAIAFETPQVPAAGAVAATDHSFALYDSEDAAKNAPDGEGVSYRVVFNDASGVPEAEAPVKLFGKRIGSVRDGALVYHPENATMDVDTTIVLQPRDIALADGGNWTDPRRQMDDMLRHLVARGLHASLSQSPPMIGGEEVALTMMPGKPGALGEGTVPEIPSTAGGGSVAGIMAQVGDVVAKVNDMPLPRIADNLRDISRHIAQLTSSPALAATLRQVDRATANVQRITTDVSRDLPPMLDEVRQTVAEAQNSLSSAQSLLSARGTVANAPGSAGLPQALYEITRTARALRELSDFLDRHPSAVLVGRGSFQ